MDISMPMDNQEFNAVVARQRAELGNFSEMVAAAAFFRMGFSVSKPLGVQKGYDLIIDTGERLVRVQVKTLSASNAAPIGWVKRTSRDGNYYFVNIPRYTDASFDYLAAVDRRTFEVFVIPMSDLDLTRSSFYVGEPERKKYQMSTLEEQKERA